MENTYVYEMEMGALTVTSDGESVTELRFGRFDGPQNRDEVTDETARQMSEYLAGRLTEFTVPVNPQGTPYQKLVWNALTEIPHGQTRSYGEIARAIGRKGARAIGMACSRNPISVIIPCHRVVGANGSLTGYGGGVDLKRRLLELEQR